MKKLILLLVVLSSCAMAQFSAGGISSADTVSMRTFGDLKYLNKQDSTHWTMVFPGQSGQAVSKTFFISHYGGVTNLDSSAATNAQIMTTSAWISPKGVYKNLRILNIGNASVDTYAFTLVKSTAVASNLPSSYTATALIVNAPASTSGILSKTTTETSVAAEGDVYALKSRTGANGSFSATTVLVAVDFYPATN